MASLLINITRNNLCTLSTAANQFLRGVGAVCHGGKRSMAVQVDVKDNRVHQALSELNRKRDEEGLTEELRKRQYFMNGSERRFERNKRSYKHAVGQVVSERVKWVMQRRK